MSPILLVTVLAFNFIVACSGLGLNLGICDDNRHPCRCGESGAKVILRVPQCTHFYRWRNRCKPCNGVIPEDLCSRFLNCAECDLDGGSDMCIACPPEKYGTWCERDCDCKNGADCDRQGECLCPEGFQGRRCENRKGCSPPEIGMPPLCHTFYPPENPLKITYSCPSDYALVGNGFSVCLSNGEWSSPPAQCIRKCSVLSSPAGGSLEYSDGELVGGVTAEVRCRKHHRLIGEPTIKCLHSGVWSSSLPTCEKLAICPDPGLPPYSVRRVGSSDNSTTGPFYEGFTLHYTCIEGYLQLGDDTILCLSNRTWSDKPAVCIKDDVSVESITTFLQ